MHSLVKDAQAILPEYAVVDLQLPLKKKKILIIIGIFYFHLLSISGVEVVLLSPRDSLKRFLKKEERIKLIKN